MTARNWIARISMARNSTAGNSTAGNSTAENSKAENSKAGSARTRWLAPLVYVTLAASAPLAAQVAGDDSTGARGRWLEVSSRQTMLEGFAVDQEGAKSHRVEALLVATGAGGGALYGRLQPLGLAVEESATVTELLLYGEFARADDDSGRFAAVVIRDVSFAGRHHYESIGTIQGVLSPRIQPGNAGPRSEIDPVLVDDTGAGPGEIDPVLHASAQLVSTPVEAHELARRLLRARSALRRMLSQIGLLPYEPIDADLAPAIGVEAKGTFRARLAMK